MSTSSWQGARHDWQAFSSCIQDLKAAIKSDFRSVLASLGISGHTWIQISHETAAILVQALWQNKGKPRFCQGLGLYPLLGCICNRISESGSPCLAAVEWAAQTGQLGCGTGLVGCGKSWCRYQVILAQRVITGVWHIWCWYVPIFFSFDWFSVWPFPVGILWKPPPRQEIRFVTWQSPESGVQSGELRLWRVIPAGKDAPTCFHWTSFWVNYNELTTSEPWKS